MLKTFSYAIYVILQCTWGAFQTLLGIFYFIYSIRCKHYFYHGSICTERSDIGGVSLGLFIFVSDNHKDGFSEKIAVHEFGHTIQSLILGPLYLIVIGLPSIIWCGLPFFKKMRREKSVSYYDLYTEHWANHLGELVLKKESAA